MTDVFKSIWPLLEAADPTITPAGWRRLASTTRQALQSSGLAKPGGFASRVPCPVCPMLHVESVIERKANDGSARYYIRCPREMRVDVYDRDRQIWRLDIRAFAVAIAESASLRGEVKALHGDRLFHLGHHAFRGVRTEVYLGRGLTRQDGSVVMGVLPAGVVTPIVFVPKSLPPNEAWGEALPRVFTLDSCHTFIDGRLGIDTRLIEAAVRRHLQGDRAPDYLFRCKGDFWEIAFKGSAVKHVKDSIGLRYIARILREPGRLLRAVDLLATEAGIDPLAASGTCGEAIDEEGRRQMREQYSHLHAEIDDAEQLNDEARKLAAQSELDDLTVELANRLNLDGNSREASDAERVRKSVSNAIRRGKTQIHKHLPELSKHLDAHLESGNTLKYAPEQEIDWILD